LLPLGELERRLRGRVVRDPAIVRLYSREPSGLEGGAEAVVFPESVEDVRELVRWAYRSGAALYPQGSGTSLSGSAVPRPPGVVVSFERMRRVRVVDGYAFVEPGVRIDELNAVLAARGYMFPVDPASSAVATVGGAVNSGAGGMRGARYGTMRDWVLGLELVLADEDASVVFAGCRTLKCRQGYDLARLIVGSEGTLALVTKAALKITPLPEQVVYALAFYPSLEDLARAVVAVREAGVLPQIMEFLDARTVDIAAAAAGVPELAGKGHMLLVGVEAQREAAERVLDWLVSTLRSHGASTIVTAWTTEEAEERGLFRVRRSLFPAQVAAARERTGSERVLVLIEDIVVPPSRLVEAVEAIRALEAKYGLPTLIGGHIGDGNLHPAVGYDPERPGEAERVHAWYMEVMEVALRLGGSVSAEHGIGVLKKEGLRLEARYRGERLLDLMRGVKRVFDPKGILNPGKVV